MTPGTINSSLSYRPLAFAKELVKKGHDVSIIAPRFDKYSKFKDKKITEISGVKIIRPLQLRTSSFELGLIPYILSSIIYLFKISPDIIQVYKATPITLGGLLLKFIKKKIVIFDTDDLDSEVMKIEGNPQVKIKLVQISEKLLLKHANAIITGSQYLKNLYSSMYKDKLIKHIPNGAEFSDIDTVKYNKNLASKRIIFIGNINRINILEPLFYVTKDLVNKKVKIRVSIIGKGQHLNYFKDLAKKLKLKEHITFYGHIERTQLRKYVKPGDIGYSYMPNELTIKACSSMKVFQYMQYGAIPLVSNVGDFPLYTFNGKTGFVAKHSNHESLTRTIIEALNNKEKQRKKIDYAKKYAAKKFNWKSLTSDVEETYNTLIKKYYEK